MSTFLDTPLGAVLVDPARVIEFKLPLLGLEKLTRFLLMEAPELRPFMWLQSVEAPEIALPLGDPWRFFPDYKLEIPALVYDQFDLSQGEEFAVFGVVTKGSRGLGMNLAAPLVIHHASRKAGQVVLDDRSYQPYHPLEILSSTYPKGA